MALEREHLRARAAFALVEAVAGLNIQAEEVRLGDVSLLNAAEKRNGNLNSEDNTRKMFNSHTHALPILIHRSGLIQSLALCLAKKKARAIVFFALVNWLRYFRSSSGMPGLQAGDWTECETYYRRMIDMSSEEVRILTAEAQSFLFWLKQFSESKFGKAEQLSNADEE